MFSLKITSFQGKNRSTSAKKTHGGGRKLFEAGPLTRLT
jgi:hypothetical protein